MKVVHLHSSLWATLTSLFQESFDQGPAQDELYPNRWPLESDIPGFRSFMENFYDRCQELHQDILRALSIGLGVEATYLQDLCNQNVSELRLNHYPACPASKLNSKCKRISEHTDFGTITLLFQDSVGGLEIEDQGHPGHYYPVPFETKSEMILNIGDCLQRWSNDKLRSTSHRVMLPPGVGSWVDDRYSVAYVGKPNRSQAVGSLPEFMKHGSITKYSNVTAWEYNQQKLLRTY